MERKSIFQIIADNDNMSLDTDRLYKLFTEEIFK